MLSHFAHFVPNNNILLIGAYRDSEVDRKHAMSGAIAAIRRLPRFESLPLKGLSSEEVAGLLEIIGDEVPPEAPAAARTPGSLSHLDIERRRSTRVCTRSGRVNRYLSLFSALENGAGWSRVYGSMACDVADTLWQLNRTDSIEIVERNIREKVTRCR